MSYSGVISPIITPFSKDGSIDFNATTRLLDFLSESGATGVFPLGSTGLFPWLSLSEKKEFISHVVENSGKLKVIAGVGSPNVNESVELSLHAKDAGADASVLMPAYYITPSQDWILRQFSDVISKNDMPFFLYNIPQLAGVWLDLGTISRLKEEFSNVIGAKESSGDMRYFSRLVDMKSNGFDVFQGQDDLLLASLSIGASGGVCGLSNFIPAISTIYSLHSKGKHSEALEVQMKIVNPLIKSVNIPHFPMGYYYSFYRKMGIEGGYRSPMLPPSEQERKSVDEALKQAESKLQRYK